MMSTAASPSTERWLGLVLAGVSTAAAVGTLLPGVLTGPAVMNGSARGTAVVVLLLAVPMLVVATIRVVRESLRARAVWIGVIAYLAYNAVMFCFATPFNRLFLLYVAMLSVSVWTLVVAIAGSRPEHVDGRRVPVRRVTTYVWLVVVLNAVAWLAAVLPALTDDLPPDFLTGTGLTTNPVHVQDLAIWLPAMAWVGFDLWRRGRWGLFLAGAGLVFWTIEAVGVAVDQWFGHRADPESSVVALAAVPMFAGLAVLGLVPLTWAFRWTERSVGGSAGSGSAPPPRPVHEATTDGVLS